MNRRDVIKSAAALVSTFIGPSQLTTRTLGLANNRSGIAIVERWGVFEVLLSGPSRGNPFVEVAISATFVLADARVEVVGFYDGQGLYRIRFMPTETGTWSYQTASSEATIDGHSGSFICVEPSPSNHGPVRVANQYHFAYADGTLYFPFGTTCYSYGFLPAPYPQQVLAGLDKARFNKVRMCVLTKPSSMQPVNRHPFVLSATIDRIPVFDKARFDPEYFRTFEMRIMSLLRRGIEAELILFYSHDILSTGSHDVLSDERYIRYAIARFSAFRNVWWSLANEYDRMPERTIPIWDEYFTIICSLDSYDHLRSIHHSRVMFDNSKPWITHASLQSYAFENAAKYKRLWNKPIIWDEVQYEGDIASRWGNLSATEMVLVFAWRL